MSSAATNAPDLVFKGLSLWLTSRLYPNAANPWDADENRCHVVVEANGTRVELRGNLPSRSIHYFLGSLQKLYDTLDGVASLDGSDLGLSLKVKASSMGHMVVAVTLTPDYGMSQRHEFNWEADQTELKPVMVHCRQILDRLPMLVTLPPQPNSA